LCSKIKKLLFVLSKINKKNISARKKLRDSTLRSECQALRKIAGVWVLALAAMPPAQAPRHPSKPYNTVIPSEMH
jgi:hypothetical protein